MQWISAVSLIKGLFSILKETVDIDEVRKM